MSNVILDLQYLHWHLYSYFFCRKSFVLALNFFLQLGQINVVCGFCLQKISMCFSI
nr:MAG TPA: hypothetical protein [Caudoviricetes sp.]